MSTFFPEPHNGFIDEHSAPTNWSPEKSSTGRIKEVILDRRWEKLEILQTPPSTNFFDKTDLHEVVSGVVDFVVPFSIRADAVDILFDDGSAAKNWTNIYWLFLQGGHDESQQEVKIMKCPAFLFEQDLCELHENKTMYQIDLSSNKWSHFKLEKRGNLLNLTQISGNVHKKIIQYNDTDLSSVGNMYITNYLNDNNNILWKQHTLEYMYTNKKTEKTRFGPVLNVDADSVCVSMFVSMCHSCNLTLTISKADTSDEMLLEESYYQKAGWSEIKFVKDIKHKQIIISISTTNEGAEDGFWAINEIRQCQKREFRMITSKHDSKCQLISCDGDVIPKDRKIDDSRITISYYKHCPEYTLGKFCLPCSFLNSTCGLLGICEKDECYSSECTCATTENDSMKIHWVVFIIIITVIIITLIAMFLLYKKYKARRHSESYQVVYTSNPRRDSLDERRESETQPFN